MEKTYCKNCKIEKNKKYWNKILHQCWFKENFRSTKEHPSDCSRYESTWKWRLLELIKQKC